MSYPALSSKNGLTRYIREINKFPILSKKEELEHARRVYEENNIKSAKILVTSHLRLVVKIAMKFRNYGLPMIDIISEGNIGLMQAIKKFNPNKGFRLSTYAIWWIRAAIQEYVLHSWSLVKIGTTSAQKKLFFNLRKIKARILNYGEGKLNDEDIRCISKELNVSTKEVVDMETRLSGHDKSLNTKISDDIGSEIIDNLKSKSISQELIIGRKREARKNSAKLNKAIQSLNKREREILTARRIKDNPETLEELSKKYLISRERVRQIENKAIEKIRLEFADPQSEV
ncbi:RNA polymerase sigma factor RpoH [Pseudomonadota bacterium]